MSRVTVIGGTGYAGSEIVRQAVGRGHAVTVLSRQAPPDPDTSVTYVQGDATVHETLESVITGADVVVSALAPRGRFTSQFRDTTRAIGRLADEAGARLIVVGGYSSLRPAPEVPRFVDDARHIPDAVRDEVLTGAAVITEDLPTTPPTLSWVFVSPAFRFGAHAPSEPLGRYEKGGEVAVQPVTGGILSAADYALAIVDLIDSGEHHREHVNVGNPAEAT